MTTELILAHPDMTLEEAITTLVNNRITGMPVVDEHRHIVGVVSEYDIIKSMESIDEYPKIDLNQKIRYTSKATTVHEDAPLQEIFKLFLEKRIRRVPVLNKKNELIGIVTRRDIMRIMFYRSKKI
ncbi:MAG: CBS domain-containing protein [Deltaproteobacteria bacterium]|nr:CBS domain-containing protein [Deltaproteobacteria bacterium]